MSANSQILSEFHGNRQKFVDRIRSLLATAKREKEDLKRDLDAYDDAHTQVIVTLTSMVQLVTVKDEQRKQLDDCLSQLEDMRSTHAKSHKTAEKLTGVVNNILELFLEMEEQQFSKFHELLRRQIVFAGTRDHVAEFRLEVFLNLVATEPDLGVKFASMTVFLDALRVEYLQWSRGSIPDRPLNAKWYEAVKRLGLEPREWAKLKVISNDSASLFHSKFTLEELKTEVFPPDLETCRPILLKAARKLQELKQQGATRKEPEAEDLPEPF